jgi:thioredoxin 1
MVQSPESFSRGLSLVPTTTYRQIASDPAKGEIGFQGSLVSALDLQCFFDISHGANAMAFEPVYHEESISRDDLAATEGPILLEFGANWCGICGGFSPKLEALMQEFPQVKHIRIEDGRGKPLGRSFRVKLWPTLVFLRDGEVIGQVSRPTVEEARQGLESITG